MNNKWIYVLYLEACKNYILRKYLPNIRIILLKNKVHKLRTVNHPPFSEKRIYN